MRYSAVDVATGKPVRYEPPADNPAAKPPPTMVHQFLPRVRCSDCPGKLYTAGPDLTVDNFEKHLRMRVHKERVEARRRSDGMET